MTFDYKAFITAFSAASSKLDMKKWFIKLKEFSEFKNIVDKTAKVHEMAVKELETKYGKDSAPTGKQCAKAVENALNSAYVRKNFSKKEVIAVQKYYNEVKSVPVKDMSNWQGAL